MRPLPFEPANPVRFDAEEHELSGVIYVAFLGAANVGMTYIEATHSLGRGMLAGAVGIVMMLIVGWIVRRHAR